MTKAEFLDRLCEGLRFHSDPAEIQKTVMFYSEAIDDRIEDGQTEEEAVEAMGSIDDIVWEIRSAWNREARSDGGEARTGGGGRVEPGQVRRSWKAVAVSRIEVFDTSGSVEILPSSDGQVHIEYTASDAWCYDITGEGAVTVRRTRNCAEEEKKVSFNFFGREFTVIRPELGGLFSNELYLKIMLPENSPVNVVINSASGDVRCENVSLASLNVKLASGDVELRHVISAGKLSVVTASGDVELTRVDAPELGVSTISGDIGAELVRAASMSMRTVSGDVKMDSASATERVSLTGVSGDITAAFDVPCRKVSADSVSGDVVLSFAGDRALYTVLAQSRSGDVYVPDATVAGPNLVRAKSLSGDITVCFVG